MKRKKKTEVEDDLPTLEGEFDVLSELERAEFGRASLYEKYHFLAILDGHMYYTIKVTGKNEVAVVDAAVIVNGNVEGKTNKNGIFVVEYSGEDIRQENIQIAKEGEHIWSKSIEIHPNFLMHVELNKMLMIDLYTYTENYGVIEGINGARIYLGDEYVGKTDRDGLHLFKYENENGVDGDLEVRIQYPKGYYPEEQIKTFNIKGNLPRLAFSEFSYMKRAVSPRISVMPLQVQNEDDRLLVKRAGELKRGIEDYLSLGDTFSVVSDKTTRRLFQQFNVEIKESGTSWDDIPFIKKEVDGVIFGKLRSSGSLIDVKLYGIDYTGETIGQIERKVALREYSSVPEKFVTQLKSNFPFEGNISAIDKMISINLGARHGIEPEDKFYSFLNYYDEIKKDYSKRRVAKLKIVEVNEDVSTGELESITEGYLLEPGVRVKRFSEPVEPLKTVVVTIMVTSGKEKVSGANIYLDDQWTGQTDEYGEIQIVMTETAYADVLVYKEGYIPEKTELTFVEGESRMKFNLKQGRTQFTIDSEPGGALLFINGKYKGNTPIDKKSIEMPYGFHRIELKLDGYKDFNQYVKFSERRLSLTGKNRIKLYMDYFRSAEALYTERDVDQALEILKSVPEEHPDYRRSMEFIGYIYLNDVKDYVLSIGYYNRVLDLQTDEIGPGESLISYYNMGQASYKRAEEIFYEDIQQSQQHYMRAIVSFNRVKERRNRLQSTNRRRIYQDVLFHLSVSNQKLYYITGQKEYLVQAYYSWIDYFDFFDNNFLEDPYFQKQFAIAESYRGEVKRLQSEE
jgi:tetratricopeptide (TPR) repeat protein